MKLAGKGAQFFSKPFAPTALFFHILNPPWPLGQLLPLEVARITCKGFETYAAHEMARGKRMGEIKPCALSTESDWARQFQTPPTVGELHAKGVLSH